MEDNVESVEVNLEPADIHPGLDPDLAEAMGEMDIEMDSEEQTLEVSKEDESEDELSADDVLKELSGEEVDTEEVEQSEDKDESTDESDFSMELERHGETQSFNEAQIKEYAQKGFDYTQKTQELAQEREAFDTEFQEAKNHVESLYKELDESKAEVETQLRDYNVWEAALTRMQKEDSELAEEALRYFNEDLKHYDSPVIKNLQETINGLKDQMSNVENTSKLQDEARENTSIINNLESERKELSGLVDKMDQLGIKVNWDKVDDIWAESGSMSLKQSLHAIYGEELGKRNVSKAKVQNVIKNSKKSSRGIASAKRAKKSEAGSARDFSSMSTSDTVLEIAKDMGISL